MPVKPTVSSSESERVSNCKYTSWFKLPISGGSVPVMDSASPRRVNCAPKLPISEGMVPVMEVPEMSIAVSDASPPILAGSVPVTDDCKCMAMS